MSVYSHNFACHSAVISMRLSVKGNREIYECVLKCYLVISLMTWRSLNNKELDAFLEVKKNETLDICSQRKKEPDRT